MITAVISFGNLRSVMEPVRRCIGIVEKLEFLAEKDTII